MNKEIQLPEMEETPYFMKNTFSLEEERAYIKQEMMNNEIVWAIYNYLGEKVGYAGSREVAFAVANQNELIGLSVH